MFHLFHLSTCPFHLKIKEIEDGHCKVLFYCHICTRASDNNFWIIFTFEYILHPTSRNIQNANNLKILTVVTARNKARGNMQNEPLDILNISKYRNYSFVVLISDIRVLNHRVLYSFHIIFAIAFRWDYAVNNKVRVACNYISGVSCKVRAIILSWWLICVIVFLLLIVFLRVTNLQRGGDNHDLAATRYIGELHIIFENFISVHLFLISLSNQYYITWFTHPI